MPAKVLVLLLRVHIYTYAEAGTCGDDRIGTNFASDKFAESKMRLILTKLAGLVRSSTFPNPCELHPYSLSCLRFNVV